MSRPLNFLHLTTFYPPYSFGGDAMYIYRLSHALGDEGHHVDVINDYDSYHMLHRSQPEITFDEHPNVKRHDLRSGYGLLSPVLTHQTGKPYLKYRKINEVLASKKFDVIHFHNISLLGPEILSIEPAPNSPIKLYTTHEHWLICPTHVLWKYNRRACEKPDCFGCTILAVDRRKYGVILVCWKERAGKSIVLYRQACLRLINMPSAVFPNPSDIYHILLSERIMIG